MKAGKKLFAAVLVVLFSGGFLFHSLPPKGLIPVLMYHYVLPGANNQYDSLYVSTQSFDRQMWFLKTFGFRPISVREFERIKSGEQKAKGREVVVTFDDGHETFLPYALPVLERYQIPVINFLIWDHVSKGRLLGGMTLEEILKLKSHPLMTFGSHTLTHPRLTEISLDQARIEMVESKKMLEEALGRPIDYFCYPAGDFNEKIVALAKEAGYRLAFATAWKSLKDMPETPYSLTRVKIGVRDRLIVFWFKISGLKQLVFGRLTPNLMSDKLNGY